MLVFKRLFRVDRVRGSSLNTIKYNVFLYNRGKTRYFVLSLVPHFGRNDSKQIINFITFQTGYQRNIYVSQVSQPWDYSGNTQEYSNEIATDIIVFLESTLPMELMSINIERPTTARPGV